MNLRYYMPADTTAGAVGADRLADLIADHINRQCPDAELVRNGSRGAFWLEPLPKKTLDILFFSDFVYHPKFSRLIDPSPMRTHWGRVRWPV